MRKSRRQGRPSKAILHSPIFGSALTALLCMAALNLVQGRWRVYQLMQANLTVKGDSSAKTGTNLRKEQGSRKGMHSFEILLKRVKLETQFVEIFISFEQGNIAIAHPMSRYEPLRPAGSFAKPPPLSSSSNNRRKEPSNSDVNAQPVAASPSSKSLENRLRKDSTLRKQLQVSLRKQNKSLRTDEFIAGGSLETISCKASLLECAKLMGAKAIGTLIVLDEGEQVTGVIGLGELKAALADGLDAKLVKAGQVMQAMPVSVQLGCGDARALSLMVEHSTPILPVLEGDELVGMLEMDTLLSKAALHEEMLLVDLINAAEPPAIVAVEPRTTVTELCRLMRTESTNAALVIDNSRMAGLISIDNLVLRVVAAGLDAATTSVVRVMTPTSETISPEVPLAHVRDILLRKEEDGGIDRRYLPVMDVDGSIVAIVDVFSLASFLAGASHLSASGLGESSSLMNPFDWEPPAIGRPLLDSLSQCAEYDCTEDLSDRQVNKESVFQKGAPSFEQECPVRSQSPEKQASSPRLPPSQASTGPTKAANEQPTPPPEFQKRNPMLIVASAVAAGAILALLTIHGCRRLKRFQ